MNGGGGESVVLIHGIWMVGIELRLLGRRLRACGFRVFYFHYPSLRRTPAENAARLDAFLHEVPGEQVHLVAHSLGGIVVMHLFNRFPPQRPGRVVLLGSPVQGSAPARRIGRIPVLRWLLGRSMAKGLGGGVPAWREGRALGVIAGTRGPGIGSLIGGLEVPNDGTVALSETQLPGATQRIHLPLSHTALVFSRQAAEETCHFLHTGRFSKHHR